MPYKKPSEVPDAVPKAKKAQFMEVWNSVYAKQKKDGASDDAAEKQAFKQAWGVINKEGDRMATKKIERRFVATELRAESQGDEMAIVGYAAKFNNLSHDLGNFREKIAPGAFKRTLSENADVRCLQNHNPTLIMGRTKNNTLTLSEDDKGLRFRSVLPPTQAARDLHVLVQRGDIDECSFGFTVAPGGDKWTSEQDDNGDFYAMRTLTDVDLLDVSAVTYPAYPGTQVNARALFPDADHEKELRSKAEELRTEFEKRADQSIEDQLQLLRAELAKAFPAPATTNEPMYPCGLYWLVDTYPTYVIVCECKTGAYFKIPFQTQDPDNDGDIDSFTFGTPEPVEQAWVPSERGNKRLTEMRNRLHELAEDYKKQVEANAQAANAEFDAQRKAADAIKAKADMTDRCMASMGNHDEETCDCQNYMSDPEEIYDDEDDSDEDRAARRAVEHRDKNGKVRTKKVGGKNLTKDKFAFVGDPERTETWKLPIHDADHVRNALARFGQTEGIPADKKAGVWRKIKAAAKKFGIHVSDDDSSRALQGVPGDELERLEWKLKFELARN